MSWLALIFPTLGSWLHLSNDGFALFAGTAVNDTSSVTATASAWDSLSRPIPSSLQPLSNSLVPWPLSLLLSSSPYWQSRQQENKQGLQLKKSSPFYPLLHPCLSLTTLSPLLVCPVVSLPSQTTLQIPHYHGYECYRSQNQSGSYGQIQWKIHSSRTICWIAIIPH